MMTRRGLVRLGLASTTGLVAIGVSMQQRMFRFPATARASSSTYARVLALGDSLTFGSVASIPNNAYAYSVVSGLRNRGTGQAMFYLLHGNPGVTTADMTTCLQQMASAETADLVIVELGTNDAGQGVDPATFQAQYVGLLGLLRQQSPAAVIVGLTCWHDPTMITPSGAAVSLYNSIISDALTNHVSGPTQCVDLAPLYLTPSYHNTTGDTFHPNDAGHAAIAAAILSVV